MASKRLKKGLREASKRLRKGLREASKRLRKGLGVASKRLKKGLREASKRPTPDSLGKAGSLGTACSLVKARLHPGSKLQTLLLPLSSQSRCCGLASL